jgi:regulator of protease activity HflC (stomatin/prohibitin superfamily)
MRLRADRHKRAAILTAGGARQAQILTAEGADAPSTPEG